jgi:hypothetical protein
MKQKKGVTRDCRQLRCGAGVYAVLLYARLKFGAPVSPAGATVLRQESTFSIFFFRAQTAVAQLDDDCDDDTLLCGRVSGLSYYCLSLDIDTTFDTLKPFQLLQ